MQQIAFLGSIRAQKILLYLFMGESQKFKKSSIKTCINYYYKISNIFSLNDLLASEKLKLNVRYFKILLVRKKKIRKSRLFKNVQAFCEKRV